MPAHTLRGGWVVPLAFALVLGTRLSVSQADVVLDGTMGGSGALAGPNFTIDAVDGRTVGTNLFHSFSEFNLTSSQSATFTNTTPAAISNVLGRITDTNASSIDGRIASTIPNANLFLMNPHGMMFGPNATLDVQGAFHATSGDYIGLADGTRFNAIPSGADVLLTTAAPSAFGFLGSTPASITVDHSQLAVPQGQTLSLVGGDLIITGTDLNTDNASLTTDGGTVNLVSIASPGEATLASPINADAFTDYGNITVTESTIDVSADTSGTVYIRGGQIVFETAKVLSRTGSGDGGNITLRGDDILVHHDEERAPDDPTEPRIRTLTTGTGTAGDIEIEADTLQVVGGVEIDAETHGPGRGGNITVRVRDLEVRRSAGIQTITRASGRAGDIVLDVDRVFLSADGTSSSTNIWSLVWGPYWSADYTSSDLGATGDGGDITVTAGEVELLGGTRIQTTTYGIGDGGDVTVVADRVFLDGDDEAKWTRIGARVGDGDIPSNLRNVIQGNGGNLSVTARDVEVRGGGASITTFTYGAGHGGDLSVVADNVLLSEAGDRRTAALGVEVGGSGDGGNMLVEAGTVRILGSAEPKSWSEPPTAIRATVNGTGNGGTVTINANHVEVWGNQAYISGATLGSGHGSDITVEADTVRVAAGGHIESATFVGPGDSGDVTINAHTVEVSDRGAITAITATGSGRGGNITITADQVSVVGDGSIPEKGQHPWEADFSSISSTSLLGSTGDAGSVTINTTTMEVRDGGAVETLTTDSGLGGTINVTAGDLTLSTGARIDASTLGSRAGGDIKVTANTITISGAGVNGFTGISAVAEPGATGDAGDINLTVRESFKSYDGSVTAAAASESGGGNITITATDMFYLVNSSIETAVQGGTGAGGNISIDPEFVVLNKSRISANAFSGPGGNIGIQAGNFVISADSSITASSALGVSGTVVVESPENDIAGSIAQLPQTFLDATTLLPESCGGRQASGQSSFVVAGRGGVAPNPDGYLPSFSVASRTPPKTAKAMSSETAVTLKNIALANRGCRQ